MEEVSIIKPTILVIGTDHFSNQDNGDLFLTQTQGILSKQRQSEMLEVINRFKSFAPTKIAVEISPDDESKLNQDFIAFQKGNFPLASNEIHQIGFRLAQICNLDHLHAVDWNETVEDIPNLGEWLENNQSKEYEEVIKIGQKITLEDEEYFQHHSIKEYLLRLNDSENIKKGHQMYMKLALIGHDYSPVGAMWTSKYWYYRNMLIYKNLVNLIDSKEDRIFVLYGAGHLHLLLQFLQESGLFNIKGASDYLR